MNTAAGTSLRDYLHSIRADWSNHLEAWFHWPPDAFLLTSRLLEDTGIYRFAVVSNGQPTWPPRDWNRTSQERAREWHEWISRRNPSLPDWIAASIACLERHPSTAIRDLYEWSGH